MPVYIPCLNVDKPDSGGGFSVGVTAYPSAGDGGGFAPGVTFTHSDSPITMRIGPVPPFVYFGPNWAYWTELFGLGETRIEREKEQIQDVMTPIFKYLRNWYDVPVRDGHALQFSSDGVQNQFERRPDLAALLPYLDQTNDMVASLVFARKNPSSGQEERVSNQFLANAAINNWPVNATLDIWDGIVSAANPQCSTDPDRWMQHPEVRQRTAQMAWLLQFIPLQTLVNMATYNNIGNPTADSIVKMWGMDPELVKTIQFVNKYPWQQMYIDNTWATGEWRNPFTGTIPLLSRNHIIEQIAGINIPRVLYPDFIVPPGLPQSPSPQPQPQPPSPQPQPQPNPQPQPQPPPTPQPVPEPPPWQPYPEPPPQPERTRPPQEHAGQPDQWDVEFACEFWQMSDRLLQIPQSYVDWTLTTNGKTALRLTRDDPYCRQYKPQPQPLPDDQQNQEIPNQQDLDRACEIVKKLLRRESLTQADYDWMLTAIGSKAIAQAVNDPRCIPEADQGQTPLPQPQSPECPEPQFPQFPGPLPPTRPPMYPIPQYPYPGPGQGPTPCPPACLELIELLRQRQEECCDLATMVVIPRLDWLTQWLIDIERRLPGPMPPLPELPLPPPNFPPPIPIPPDIDVPPSEPPVPIPPLFPPEIVACLQTLCDQENFCKMVQDCERELECKEVPLCDENGGPWGAMAECWLQANTPTEDDIEQSYAGQQFPQYGVNQFMFAWEAALVRSAQEIGDSGQYSMPDGEQDDLGDYYRNAQPYVQAFLSAWDGNEYDPPGTEDPEIVEPPYIFADPADAHGAKFKFRSLKLREGELDPCEENPGNVLEIPPQGAQP